MKSKVISQIKLYVELQKNYDLYKYIYKSVGIWYCILFTKVIFHIKYFKLEATVHLKIIFYDLLIPPQI